MNTVWIYGEPSTGKTEFLDQIKIIFSCAEFKETRGRFDCKYKISRMAPDFISIDEGANKNFFKANDNYSAAKKFFEGQGLVLETKCKHPRVVWKSVPVIIATNDRDPILETLYPKPYE